MKAKLTHLVKSSVTPFTSRRFPWRNFSRIILAQALIILGLFLTFSVYLRGFLYQQLSSTTPAETLDYVFKSYDTYFYFFLSATILTLIVFAISLTKKLVFPLGRVLIKTRSFFAQEHGGNQDNEWTELESSLENIQKDLNSKIENLRIERHEQETIMSAISDAILAVDMEGVPLFYNSRFALLFNHLGLGNKQRLWEMIRDPEILESFRKSLKEGKATPIKAIPFVLPNNEKRYFSASISPLRKANRSIYGAVGIFHDVTDLKKTEQIRIDFVANVSHELRTPLTSIKGYVDTLVQDIQEQRPIPPAFIEAITRNVNRLMNLINDLLDLSAIESAGVVQKSILNTEELTHRVLKQMEGSYQARNQRVTVHVNAPIVFADSKRIEQVLVNLLDNAIKYTPCFGSISLSWEQLPNQDTLFKISDTGPGIPVEHHGRLFERFYRVDRARSREQGGTGLGLAIVKHIMQHHDGSVWLESEPGHGTTFLCSFPAVNKTLHTEARPGLSAQTHNEEMRNAN